MLTYEHAILGPRIREDDEGMLAWKGNDYSAARVFSVAASTWPPP
jgi:hypothetical protein